MNTPNFFRFASSELSQDAFICWLLEWANPKPDYIEADNELHKVAQAFVRLLLLPDKSTANLHISSIECISQKNNIDILALIKDEVYNKQYALIIEDKIDTTIHDNQLVRYSEDIKKRYKNWEHHCVYFKTGNESKHSLGKIEKDYNQWSKDNNFYFKIVLREKVLEVLGSCKTTNLIFTDFIGNLNRIQRLTETYKNQEKVVGMWGNTAWQGFFMKLEEIEILKKGEWDNNHHQAGKNKKGTVLSGWEFKLPRLSVPGDKSVQIYFNLCLNNLSLKAYCNSTSYPQGIDNVSEINSKLSEYNLKLDVCEEMHKAKNMTLASIKKVNGKSFISKNKPLDFEYVAEKLKQLQKFLRVLAKYIKF